MVLCALAVSARRSAIAARRFAVSSRATIWIDATIGTAMIAPTAPSSVPNTSTLEMTRKPETSAALPRIVGCSR